MSALDKLRGLVQAACHSLLFSFLDYSGYDAVCPSGESILTVKGGDA